MTLKTSVSSSGGLVVYKAPFTKTWTASSSGGGDIVFTNAAYKGIGIGGSNAFSLINSITISSLVGYATTDSDNNITVSIPSNYVMLSQLSYPWMDCDETDFSDIEACGLTRTGWTHGASATYTSQSVSYTVTMRYQAVSLSTDTFSMGYIGSSRSYTCRGPVGAQFLANNYEDDDYAGFTIPYGTTVIWKGYVYLLVAPVSVI